MVNRQMKVHNVNENILLHNIMCFKKDVRGACFMCLEVRQCMKIGPMGSSRVCGVCYTHPSYESLVDDMFEFFAKEIEDRIAKENVE